MIIHYAINNVVETQLYILLNVFFRFENSLFKEKN